MVSSGLSRSGTRLWKGWVFFRFTFRNQMVIGELIALQVLHLVKVKVNGLYSTKIVGRVLFCLSTLWACRWINHCWSLWRMASLTSDLRLPSQPQVPYWCQIIHCLVTEACEQLAQGCYLKLEWPGVEPVTFCVVSQHPKHYTTRPSD